MAVRTVQNILQHPGSGAPIAGRDIKIRLNVPGFTSTGTIEKAATRIVTTDATGLWTCALEVNADIDPAGTWYTVQEVQGVIWTFAVPAGVAAINLRDCLITNPANPNPILSTVSSVNGHTGVVILGAADVGADVVGAAAAAQAAAAADATTKVAAETARATTAEALALAKVSNLSDVANAATARANLGLGSAATQASSAFDTAGAASAAQAAAIAASAQRASNLSDLASAATARTNLGLGTAATQDSTAFDAAGAAVAQRGAVNVLTLGVKGDVVTVTDAAITSGTTALASATAAFTTAHVGMRVMVVDAGTPYTNRGAWATATAYATGDLITSGGNSYIALNAHTSPATFTVNKWSWLPYAQTAQTLYATILSVSAGVATLDVAAGQTVSGGRMKYGTDDTAACLALPAGDYYFPNRTYFLSDWFMLSNTTVFSAGATFCPPYNTSTDMAVFRLLTSNRTLTSYLSNIHLRGKFTIDMTELTVVVGTNPRGVHALNCTDWSVDQVTGVGIPGSAGNVMQTGANQGLAYAQRYRVALLKNTVVRGVGSSCVQHTGGTDAHYGSLWTDSGIAARLEMDSNTAIADNIVVEMAHNTGAGLFPNAAVALTPHDMALSNVHVKAIRAEGTANGVHVSYDTGGSLSNITVERMRVTGGGQGVNINKTGLSFTNFVVRDSTVDGAGTVTLVRDQPLLPGVGFCVAPGMTYTTCRSINCTQNGWQDISQASVVTGTVARLYDCEATGNTFFGLKIDKTELVHVFGGKFSTNNIGVNAGTGCTVVLHEVDTRSNTASVFSGAGLTLFVDAATLAAETSRATAAEALLSPLTTVINAQVGTSYTAALTDAAKFVTMTNASASTFTIPPNSSVAFPVGAVLAGAQLGAGQVTITPGAAVTLNGQPGLKVAARYGSWSALKTATDTWLVVGALAA